MFPARPQETSLLELSTGESDATLDNGLALWLAANTLGSDQAGPCDHRIRNNRRKPTASAAGLTKGAIGIVAVIFMAVANAAPITAMTGNVPIAVGFGNGLGAPAGFLFATTILTLFALGYVAMARHITTTGAFYGFISHGLPHLPPRAGVVTLDC